MRNIILIVDDNLTCAEPLQIALESIDGMDVRIAADGEAVLRLLTASPDRVAALITDLRMPSISGLELLHRVQSDASLRQIPVLIVSGDSDPELPARTYSGGASAFFTKPYSPLAVRRRLEQLLA